jgi:hypothetical protein
MARFAGTSRDWILVCPPGSRTQNHYFRGMRKAGTFHPRHSSRTIAGLEPLGRLAPARQHAAIRLSFDSEMKLSPVRGFHPVYAQDLLYSRKLACLDVCFISLTYYWLWR